MTLRRIEIMEVCSLRATTVIEVVDRVSARATHSTIYNKGGNSYVVSQEVSLGGLDETLATHYKREGML